MFHLQVHLAIFQGRELRFRYLKRHHKHSWHLLPECRQGTVHTGKLHPKLKNMLKLLLSPVLVSRAACSFTKTAAVPKAIHLKKEVYTSSSTLAVISECY